MTDHRARGAPVAYVMSRFPKLTETFILREILAMERIGVKVELYPLLRERSDTLQPGAAALVERAHYAPFLSRAVLASQVWFLRDRQRRRRWIRALLDMLAGTWRSPNFLLGGIGIFPKVAHAARAMAAGGVAHVHCHFANHPALAGFLIHRLVGIPYSFTAHGSDLHVDRTMLPRKVAEAAFVVAISEDNRRVIIDTCGPAAAERIRVIHCGVDVRRFTLRERVAGPTLRIVTVGTLHEVKGQRHVVLALAALQRRGVAASLRLVGDGPDRSMLEALAREAGVADLVHITGRLPEDRVLEELHDADVLVAPSVPTGGGKREGIPVVLMEGMAVGLPVVASRLSGIPELVEDGISGLLVPPGDSEALADALATLAADVPRRRAMGLAGRTMVERDFDVDRNAAALLGEIGDVRERRVAA